MNITTNQDTLRPNFPSYFTLYAHDLEFDVNRHGTIVRITDTEGERAIPSTEQLESIRPTITEILADIQKCFTWFKSCEADLGAQLDDPDVMLRQPIGHWCIADAVARTVVLRECRSLIDTKAVGFSA